MCKPGKSFNTGVKSDFSSHESAPPHTDALIGPAACGRCPNPDSLKQRAVCALALESLEPRL